jgi:hypothetical protein
MTTGWAVTLRDGRIIAEFDAKMTEAQIWQIALGWPAPGEVEWEKQNGARAWRCRLEELPNGP